MAFRLSTPVAGVALVGTLLAACGSDVVPGPGAATGSSTSATTTTTGEAGGAATGGGGATGTGGGTTTGTGGAGGGTCCDCPDGFSCTSTLECFCSMYSCTPMPGGDGPFAGSVTFEYADCDRTLYFGFVENEGIAHLVETSTGTLVGAQYTQDAGVCGVADGQLLHAGEPFQVTGEVPGCTLSGCQATGGGECP